MAYVPYQYEELGPSAAEILKRQRRAEALRKSQEGFESVRRKPPQELQRSVKGGLYETVPMYAPKSTLASVAELGGGLLGEYLTGRSAKKEETALDEARVEGTLRASQQLGADGLPVAPPLQGGQATIGSGRMGAGLAAAGFPAPGAAPGMAPPPVTGGPEAATAPAPFPQQNSNVAQELAGADVGQETLDQLALLENDRGRALDDTQLREFLQTQKVQTPDSPEAPPAPPRSQDELAAYLGIGSGKNPTLMPEPAAPAAPKPSRFDIAEFPPEVKQGLETIANSLAEQGIPEPEIDARMEPIIKAAFRGEDINADMIAAATAGATNPYAAQAPAPGAAEPATPAPPVEPSPAATDINAMLGMAPAGGPPAGPQGTAPTDQALRAYLGIIGGPDMKDVLGSGRRVVKTQNLEGGKILKIFNDGTEEISDNIAESRSKERYDEATGYVYRSFSTGPNAGTVQLVTNEDGTPLKLTPSEANARGIGRGKAVGQAEGEAQTSDIAAQTAAKIEEARRKAVMETEHRLNARYALPGAKALTAQTERDVNLLLNNKEGLKQIVGSKLTARLSTLGTENAIAGLYAGGIHAGTPMANAFAAHMQLTSKAFLDSYRDAYKGTGPVSNVEGLKGAQSNLQQALYQTQDVYEQRLREYIEQVRLKEQQLAAAGLDPVNPQYAPQSGGVDAQLAADLEEFGG